MIGPSKPEHQQTKRRRTSDTLQRRRERWFYLLITPWLFGFVLFQVVPILGVGLLALLEWPLPQPPTFIGLDHFMCLATDSLALKTLVNTLYYASGTMLLTVTTGLALALLLNERRPGMGVLRTLFFLPTVMSSVALTLIWGWIFNVRNGLLNASLALVGIRGPAWLQDEQWAMPALILMSLWSVGINMVIYLAALEKVPLTLHEAAALDGAGQWRRFRSITWPMLSPITFYLIIVNIIGSFQIFTPTYILTRGGPNNATLTMPLYIYFNAFNWGNLGYAATLATLLLFTVAALTLVQFLFADRWVFYQG